MLRVENYIVLVTVKFAAGYIQRVIVATRLHLTMEQEAQRRLTPRQVRVLTGVQVTPGPILWPLRYVLRQESRRVSHSLGDIVGAEVLAFVLGMCLLT